VNPGFKATLGCKLANAFSVIEDVIRVEDNGDNGLVGLLYVHPEYARRGLGRELLEVGCTWAVARGRVQAGNRSAQAGIRNKHCCSPAI
jgi:GNAT superfamily N-acetyltransferase